MKKLLLLLAASAALLAACGSLGPTAVTINGERISEEEFNDELRQIRDNEAYREAVNIPEVEGTGKSGTVQSGFAARVLTLRLYYELVHQELKERDLEVTDAELAAARRTLASQLASDPQTGQADVDAGEKILDAFSGSYRDTVVRRQAELDKLMDELADVDVSDDAVEDFYRENAEQFQQACARHVLVETPEAAAQVVAQLSAGTDFGQVAAAQSTDPSAQENNGDLGCATPDTYVPEFAEAVRTQAVGAIGEPVQTQFGHHVIQVYERRTQALEDVEDEIRQRLSQGGNQAINEWLIEALREADVEVNPKFGRYEAGEEGRPGQIVPPEPGPAGRTATTTTAPAP